MTQAQLDSQIARLTGESLTEIHPLGFSLESDHHDDLEPATVRLVLDSVRQTRTQPNPQRSRARSGLPAGPMAGGIARGIRVSLTPRTKVTLSWGFCPRISA